MTFARFEGWTNGGFSIKKNYYILAFKLNDKDSSRCDVSFYLS